jgi:hypothetical protein
VLDRERSEVGVENEVRPNRRFAEDLGQLSTNSSGLVTPETLLR